MLKLPRPLLHPGQLYRVVHHNNIEIDVILGAVGLEGVEVMKLEDGIRSVIPFSAVMRFDELDMPEEEDGPDDDDGDDEPPEEDPPPGMSMTFLFCPGHADAETD